MKLTLRGRQYSLEAVRHTQIMPLVEVFGEPPFPEEGDPGFKEWLQGISLAIAKDPVSQGVMAYVLTNLFPDLDPAIARFVITKNGKNSSGVGYLSVDSDELLEIYLFLGKVMDKAQPDAIVEVAEDEKGDRIKELETELAKLKEPSQ